MHLVAESFLLSWKLSTLASVRDGFDSRWDGTIFLMFRNLPRLAPQKGREIARLTIPPCKRTQYFPVEELGSGGESVTAFRFPKSNRVNASLYPFALGES